MRSELAARDSQVVALVGAFTQVDSSHVHELLFSHQAHRTSVNDALLRLTDRKYLRRFRFSLNDSERRGRQPYVYQLDRRGHYFLNKPGEFSPSRGLPSLHKLGIADIYLALVRLERAGALRIGTYRTEPECHAMVGGVNLQPDLYVKLQTASAALRLWFEFDMATEGRTQLKSRLAAYWRAYNDCDWPVFPRTVWVGVDNERATELRRLIGAMPPEQQALFTVCTRETLSLVIT